MIVWAAVLTGLALLVPAPKAPDPKQQALRVLRSRHPDVLWQLERPITAELTGDGEADLAITGNRGADFVVGIIVGPVGPLSEMLRMTWRVVDLLASSDCSRSGAPALALESVTLPADLWGCLGEDAQSEFCSRVLKLEAWLREASARGMQGLRVTGVNCEDVHLHWNPETQHFDYWTAR